jgi:hypothetical protein
MRFGTWHESLRDFPRQVHLWPNNSDEMFRDFPRQVYLRGRHIDEVSTELA